MVHFQHILDLDFVVSISNHLTILRRYAFVSIKLDGSHRVLYGYVSLIDYNTLLHLIMRNDFVNCVDIIKVFFVVYNFSITNGSVVLILSWL